MSRHAVQGQRARAHGDIHDHTSRLQHRLRGMRGPHRRQDRPGKETKRAASQSQVRRAQPRASVNTIPRAAPHAASAPDHTHVSGGKPPWTAPSAGTSASGTSATAAANPIGYTRPLSTRGCVADLATSVTHTLSPCARPSPLLVPDSRLFPRPCDARARGRLRSTSLRPEGWANPVHAGRLYSWMRPPSRSRRSMVTVGRRHGRLERAGLLPAATLARDEGSRTPERSSYPPRPLPAPKVRVRSTRSA